MIHVLIALTLGLLPILFVYKSSRRPSIVDRKPPPAQSQPLELHNDMPSAFTPDSQLDLLFNSELIPSDVKAQLGSDLHLRPLARCDLKRNHLGVLAVLTSTPNLTEEQYQRAFDVLRSCNNTYYTIVIVAKETDSIVGVGTVFMEQKFTRNLGRVGHIEDIAVDKNVQGRKLGLRVIQALTGISEKTGCYKTILNCSDHNVPFYEKCGFEKKENEMARYHNVATAAPPATERVVAPRL